MKKILFFTFLFLPWLVQGQKLKKLESNRLKVGVVLSGGGAKGIAHIGVLKELEANGIQIDYIAGTSMGAIVGGLYAAGYSPEEMIEIIRTTDFEAILSDKVERKYKTIYDKRKGEKYIITLPFTNNKLSVPVSLSKGQGALNLLTELFEPVDTIQDFSKLPVPFFCIATDAATGDMAVLEEGSLPLAIRASASFPTFFQPVEMNNHLYIDGGIASNLPVREMKKKDVDVIIASDVQGKLKTKDEINSALTLLDQIISFEMYRKVDEEAKLADIYVHPDIDGFSTFTFDDPLVLVNSGEQVIKDNETAFKKLASIQGSYAPKRTASVKVENKKFKLDSIRIDGNKSYSNKYVLKTIGVRVGDSITYDELNDRISSMTYRKTIERLDYRIYEYEDDKYALRINLKESRNKSFVKIGLHYDPLYQTGVLLNFTTNHLLQKGDLLSADVVVGDNLRYELDYVADSGGFLAYGLMTRYNHFDDNIALPNPAEVSRVNVNYNDYTTRIFGEMLYQKEASLGIGLEYKYLYADTKTLKEEDGSDLLLTKSHYFSTFAYLDYDVLDDANYPKSGLRFQSWAQYFFNSNSQIEEHEPFAQLRADFTAAYSFLNKKLTAQITLDAGVSLQYSPDVLDFYLGSYGENYVNNFIPFYGYDFASVGGSSYGRTVLDLRWEAVNNFYLLAGGNVGKAEDGIFEESRVFENPMVGYVVGGAWNSPIGPIELRYGNSPKEKTDQVYFNLGFWF